MAPASRFYTTDPLDEEAPMLLSEYTNEAGQTIRPGSEVYYVRPMGLEGAHKVEELYLFPATRTVPDRVSVILDGGKYECSAENLRLEPV